FFFQAEDGIRDYKVTGVQTCALPICSNHFNNGPKTAAIDWSLDAATLQAPAGFNPASPFVIETRATSGQDGPPIPLAIHPDGTRSEERRVGKECRCRWGPEQ